MQAAGAETKAMTGARLQAEPSSSLVDEVVSIRVSDLQSAQQVTMVTRLQDAGNRFLGHAWYTADDQGVGDVQAAESRGGSFTGTVFIYNLNVSLCAIPSGRSVTALA